MRAPLPLLIVLSLCVLPTACGGAATWSQRTRLQRTLDQSPTAWAPLWRCDDPGEEGALCELADADVARARCEDWRARPETAFTGHRCLAMLALRAARARDFGTLRGPGIGDPSRDESEQLEAFEAHRLTSLEEAREHLAAALAITPDDPALIAHRAELLMILEDEAGLLVDLEAAARLSVDDPAALDRLHRLGTRALHADGGDALAARRFEAVSRGAPSHAPSRADLGVLYMLRGDLERAREHLEAAQRARPDDPLILASLIQVHVFDARLEDAQDVAARSVDGLEAGASLPAPVIAAVALGDVARGQALRARALMGERAALERFLDVLDASPDAVWRETTLLAEAPSLALMLILSARRHTDDIEGARAHSEALSRLGLSAQRVALWRDALAKAPVASSVAEEARLRLASAWLDAGQPERAVEVLDGFDASPPPPAFFLRGQAQLALGHADEARRAFEAISEREDEWGALAREAIKGLSPVPDPGDRTL